MRTISKRIPRTRADTGFSRVTIDGADDHNTVDDAFDSFGFDRGTYASQRLDDASLDHIGERWNGGKRTIGGFE